jgi:hypothetical protein
LALEDVRNKINEYQNKSPVVIIKIQNLKKGGSYN